MIPLVVNALGFTAIYATLISFFTPELMLSNTTTAGGDTGAHIYVADYLRNHLLPNGRITGWSPGWYAGFPMLVFYFPLPFLLIAFLSIFLKFQIAFKLITALGIFLLPLTTYLAFKVLDFRFPLPIIAAGFTLPFLFMESYSIYGANILSTLAGEFGYSISFSLSILFLALLYRDIKNNHFRVSTGVLLGLIALSHIVTTIVVVLLSTYFLINRLTLKRFLILCGVFGLGFLLSAFWGIPFIDKIEYTAHMKWNQLSGFNELFPIPVRTFLPLTLIGLIFAIAKRNSQSYLHVWAITISLALFLIMPPGRLWNGRLLPFFYYFTYIWAAYGLWFLRRFLAQVFYKLTNFPKRHAEMLLAFAAIAFAVMFIFKTVNVADDWIVWNYSGFEGKAFWKDYNRINQYIKNLPEGRVMVEHSEKIDLFGTPRAFELLPYFAHHPTMEGTLMEASISAPFHFINQAELSKDPSYAILGIKYPNLDVEQGIEHLKIFNIRYFLALSSTVKKKASSNPNLELLKTFKVPDSDLSFNLYEVKSVNTKSYVRILRNEPLLVDAKDWRKIALKWYSNKAWFDTVLIDFNHAKQLKGHLKEVPNTFNSLPLIKIKSNLALKGKVSNVKISDDEISFNTTAIGIPHLIKISYFPNWKAYGADGPYLATPSLMVVIPKKSHVKLTYGYTTSDILGITLSLISWLGVILYGFYLVAKKTQLLLRKKEQSYIEKTMENKEKIKEGILVKTGANGGNS